MSTKRKNPVFPSYAWLTVNRVCNFRCEWCYAQGMDFAKDQDMDLETAIRLTEILVESGTRHLFLTGGEPTLWEPLLEFNSFCKKIGLKTTLMANGMSFGNDAYWEKYSGNPNTYVGVSLKAGSREQLVETTRVRQFDLVTKGIRRAMEHFQSDVGIVYSSINADGLVELCRYAVEDCHANSVKIDFCTPVFVEGQPIAPGVVSPLESASKIVSSYPEIDRITSGGISFIMSIPLCLWPKEFIEKLEAEDRIESVCHLFKREGVVILNDGSLCMCNELFDFPIGQYKKDFTDAVSLIKLLNNTEINSYYDEISRYPSVRCQECSWYAKCGGGCPLFWSVYDPEKFVTPIRRR